MKYIRELRDGERLVGIYLCKHKQSAMTKNGKPYDTVLLQDKTGVLDGKIWDPNSYGIEDFEDLDYIEVTGDIITFAGALQLNIKRVRRASTVPVIICRSAPRMWRKCTRSFWPMSVP